MRARSFCEHQAKRTREEEIGYERRDDEEDRIKERWQQERRICTGRVSRGGTADGRQHVVAHLSGPVPAGSAAARRSRSATRSGLNVLDSSATTHEGPVLIA
jgi:hypothetical protein